MWLLILRRIEGFMHEGWFYWELATVYDIGTGKLPISLARTLLKTYFGGRLRPLVSAFAGLIDLNPFGKVLGFVFG